MSIRRLASVLICAGWLLAPASPLSAQIPQHLTSAVLENHEAVKALAAQGKLEEAERSAIQYIESWKRTQPRYPALAAFLRIGLALVYELQWRLEEAERQIQLGLQEVGAADYHTELIRSDLLNQLGNVHTRQRRFAEAERDYRQAMAIALKRHGAESGAYAMIVENVGNVLTSAGKFFEGIPLYKQALAIKLRAYGRDTNETASAYQNIGITLEAGLSRHEEAEPYLREAQRIYAATGNLPGEHEVLLSLAKCRIHHEDWEQAEKHIRRRKAIREQVHGPTHPLTLDDTDLGDLYFFRGKLPEAEAIYRRSIDGCRQAFGELSTPYGDRLLVVANTLDAQGKEVEAEVYASQAIELFEKLEGNLSHLARAYEARASARSDQSRLEDAVADYREAVRLAELARSQISGSEVQRAEHFATNFRDLYVALAWHLHQLGKVDEALEAAERGRARSLLDQIELAHTDLLRDVPPAEAERLRAGRQQAERQVADLEGKLSGAQYGNSLSAEARLERAQQFYRQLAVARRRLVDAHTEIRNASPLYRKVLAQTRQGVDRSNLESWLRENQLCLLYYTVSDAMMAHVVVYGHDQPLPPQMLPRPNGTGGSGASSGSIANSAAFAEPPAMEVKHTWFLEITPAQAAALGVDAGAPTDRVFSKLLLEKDGVLPQLSRPQTNAAALPKLAALWEVLIPPTVREALVRGDFKGLVVVPDGSLSLIPFEALIVAPGPEPRYLLDDGPPITYAPSATILYDLAKRESTQTPLAEASAEVEAAAPPPVGRALTVGDALYQPADARAGSAIRHSLRARYGAMGGQLTPLPYTKTESNWMKQVLDKARLQTSQLTGASATEGNVRRNIADCQIVHLACHGLADRSYGNFFGALALTPGASGASEPADDGFLALPEICELDLRGNELTILSACQTNYGPHQHGEGVWALTRGFLVAGARRVVATDWVVDDEASAHLISYLGSYLGKAYAEGTASSGYARALQAAKRGVRQQERWSNPFYWAPFVLVGPD